MQATEELLLHRHQHRLEGHPRLAGRLQAPLRLLGPLQGQKSDYDTEFAEGISIFLGHIGSVLNFL